MKMSSRKRIRFVGVKKYSEIIAKKVMGNTNILINITTKKASFLLSVVIKKRCFYFHYQWLSLGYSDTCNCHNLSVTEAINAALLALSGPLVKIAKAKG